jgi:hypothetical protein
VKSYGNRAFSNYAPTVWNKLPVSVRSASSLPRFRTALKTHFFCIALNNYFPASVVSQKAPLIICAYVKVRLIEMQYIIIIIIIIEQIMNKKFEKNANHST